MAEAFSRTQLSAGDRQAIEQWQADFERNWSKEHLPQVVERLPGAVDPLRGPILLALVCADLKRQWQAGGRPSVESYLERFPELGTVDKPPFELVQAEYDLRREEDGTAALTELMQRFPGQANQLQSQLEPTSGDAREGIAFAETVVQSGPPAATHKPPPPAPAPAPPLVKPTALPDQFGRYRIVKTIGKGGMGTVYLAQDTQLDRPVALKVPHIEPDDGPEMLTRFYREAKAAATLHHPNICPVYDVGECQGVPYLTMAFIEGRALIDMVKGRKPLPLNQAAVIVRQVARAMDEAHRKGVIHRDLKPSNILIDHRGEPVVMDFGVARQLNKEGGGERLTQMGRLVGTPEYMAPEQAKGDINATGPSSDIYSLGVIFYRLLTGRLPFEGSMVTVLALLVTEHPPPPSAHNPEVDPRLEAICLKAMAKEPADRYATMGELAAALDEYLQGEGVGVGRATSGGTDEVTLSGPAEISTSSPAMMPPSVSVSVSASSTESTAATVVAARHVAGGMRLLAVAILAALAGAAYWWLTIGPGLVVPWSPATPTGTTPLVRPDDKEGQLFAAASEAIERQDYDQAIQNLDELLGIDPKYGRAYLLRAHAHAAKASHDQVVADCSKALEFPEQQTAETYRLRGQAYLALKNDQQAEADLTAAIERNPRDAAARVGRATANLRLKKYREAIDDCHAALQIDITSQVASILVPAYQAQGEQYLAQKDYDRALDCFSAATELDPKNESLLVGRGDALAGRKNWDEAVNAYNLAWRNNPRSAAINQRLDHAWEQIVGEFLKLNDHQNALRVLDDKVRLDPTNPWPLYHRGKVFLARGGAADSEFAIDDLLRALRLAPARETEIRKQLDDAYLRYSETLSGTRQKKDWERAVAEFTRRIDNDKETPRNSWPWIHRGRASHMIRNYQSALEDLDQALKLNPKDSLALRYRGDVHADLKEWNQARKDLEQAWQLNPEELRNWSQYLHVLLQSNDPGDLQRYRELCSQLLDRFGSAKDPSTCNLAAWLCLIVPDAVSEANRQKTIELAQTAWTAIAEKGQMPADLFYRNTLAVALFRAGSFKEAVEHLQGNLEDRSKRAVGPEKRPYGVAITSDWIFLGLAYHRLNNTTEATRFLDLGLKGIDLELQSSGVMWNRRVELQLFRREIEEARKKP